MNESDIDEPDAEKPDLPPDAPAPPSSSAKAGERIAKRLARAGLCSRRDAERWIAEGRVTVDGHKLSSPALNVTDQARILVDGKPIPVKTPTRLWRYSKPRGLLTTNRDPEGRRTIFDELPKELPRVITIGRLDYNSEGLLLLTNDGELARKLELPSTGWARRYRVRVNGDVDPLALSGLAKGITIEGVRYGAIGAQLDRQQGDNAWITMSLTEGKNREVRRICEHMGWQVSRLIRIAYGPFQLGLLEPGGVEEVSPRVVKEQMGEGTGGAATAAEKRRLREETHDEKRRLKREETAGAASKKLRPGKRDRDAKYAGAKSDAHRAAPARGPREDRDAQRPRGEKPFSKPDQPFEPRDRALRGKRGERRLEKIEENFETREARSFVKPDGPRFDKRHDRPAPRDARAKRSINDRDAKRPVNDRDAKRPGDDRTAKRPGDDRAAKRSANDRAAKRPMDAGAKRPINDRDAKRSASDRDAKRPVDDRSAKRPVDNRGAKRPDEKHFKKDRRGKPGGAAGAKPGHAHRRRPS
ncbi:pseudouridine synthase [Hypericibacter sp.]|uniref:pseudouridine synthase n=1 Tax=Hypericibacter sp. TaxID=2705401 RepID=UPI003D6D2D88